jgi:hypothetical protein
MFGASLFLAPQSHAAPLTWHLQGAIFGDGGTATGSFVYDAATDAYSAINIVTTVGTALPGATFTVLSTGTPRVFGAFETAGTPPGSRFLQLQFVSSLTDAGGSVNILIGASSAEGTCSLVNTCVPTFPARFFSAGLVTTNANAVPEPATVALVPAALLALAITRRVAEKRC